jgi:D-3-phosphoglycerate dehydrogenase / 2-oxoglutarate reductase
MYKVQLLDNISKTGLDKFPTSYYQAAAVVNEPDAILVRSHDMHNLSIPASLQVVGRAGAGTNNIPISKLTNLGIPVLNTPNANANAVRELVIAGILLACRNIKQAWAFVHELSGDDAAINRVVEENKKKFVGSELPGKTLGVIGLGAIGVRVANAALALGMKVIGFDPTISLQRAWELSAEVQQANSLDELIKQSSFITLHVPLNEETRNMISADSFRAMNLGTILLNFSRDGIVDNQALLAALNEKHVGTYVCDFPTSELKDHPQVICLPHLGASTKEAEENCAVMVVEQVREYLELGNIKNSVNFPDVTMPYSHGFRLTIANANVPTMVSQIATKLGEASLNINDMINKSRGEIAYSLFDLDTPLSEQTISEIKSIKGVIKVRCITKK